MDRATLKERVRLGEDSRREFKSIAASDFRIKGPTIAKAVAALANSGGGEVYVGVEDDGTASGIGSLQQADALMRHVSQVCQDVVQPGLTCRMTKEDLDGTAILIVEVPAFAPDRPFSANGKYYVRDANRSREATRSELSRLFQSIDHNFDEEPVAEATLDDLDLRLAHEILGKLYDAPSEDQTAHYLRALKCLDEEKTPTVAGLLFFGREPQRWLLDAYVTTARIAGTQLTPDAEDRQTIGGPLTEQIEKTRDFLARHVPRPHRVEGWDGVDEPAIADAVLREAVLNAVAHRDYRVASQIRIFVYDDRLEVINPGALLNRLTLENIRVGGISQRRNPTIASLLMRLQGRESFGAGIPAMFAWMRQHGRPEPEIGLEGGHFRLVLRFAADDG